MKIWASLYLIVWIAFLEFVSIFANNQGWLLSVEIHALLGLIIIILAFKNHIDVSKTEAPSRIKRILKATAGLTVAQAVLGIILFINIRIVAIPFVVIIDFLMFTIALAIIAQAASAATAYDMWEEKEFTQATK